MFKTHLCNVIVAPVVGLLLWGACPVDAQVPQPGIGLSVDEIEQVANRVRAGRSLQPEQWGQAPELPSCPQPQQEQNGGW